MDGWLSIDVYPGWTGIRVCTGIWSICEDCAAKVQLGMMLNIWERSYLLLIGAHDYPDMKMDCKSDGDLIADTGRTTAELSWVLGVSRGGFPMNCILDGLLLVAVVSVSFLWIGWGSGIHLALENVVNLRINSQVRSYSGSPTHIRILDSSPVSRFFLTNFIRKIMMECDYKSEWRSDK